MDGNGDDIVDWVRLYQGEAEEDQEMYSDKLLDLSLCVV